MRILIVKLGAMGDVIHTLPAAAALRRGYPNSHITWVVDPKWAPLLDANPHISQVIQLNRRELASIRSTAAALRAEPFELAIDFQGLIKSGLVARASGARQRWGFVDTELREAMAGMFYTSRGAAPSAHVVEKNLDLALAAGAAPPTGALEFALPPGAAEGALPDGPFVLACPQAGWAAKEWPAEYYTELAAMLPCPLVLNGPASSSGALAAIAGCGVHTSGLPGLIHATRRATAILGIDSGPLHLAAALGKPGVAIFGPTDPARNGAYGGTIQVLRDPAAATTYKRSRAIAPSMRNVTPQQAAAVLLKATSHAIS